MNGPCFQDKNTAIRRMNELGFAKKPFIFIIDSGMNQVIVNALEEVIPDEILYSFNGLTNYTGTLPVREEFFFRKQPVSFQIYKKRFEQVINHISYGNSYLLNLTCPTPIFTNLNLREIFYRSKARYKLWLKDSFVVFSPETFITIQNGIIASFPMKGTIDASLADAEKTLLSDNKELAEHYTIVDLIRNDLNRVAKKVKVEQFRTIEKILTNSGSLLQMSSKITGKLPDDYLSSLGDILFSLLPAGSVTGAPKEKTVQIIREVEQYERGFYTGIAGIFDGQNLDSAVLIRYIEMGPEGLIFKSGGGITSSSLAEQEYHEMIDKVYVPFT